MINRLIMPTLVSLTILTGCSSMRNGGAPDPSFDVEADLKELSVHFGSATSISKYYEAELTGKKSARNEFISGRLVQIDLQYLKFIRTLTSDKQQLDAAAEIFTMSLNLAGTLVGSAQAKTNLAAAAAAIGGATTTIDKEFYYEKSIGALVATMNAKRKETLVSILSGMSNSVDQYPFERAITDLHQYYLAGTLNGAIQFINVQAAASEAKSTGKLNDLYELPVLPEAQIEYVKKLTKSLASSEITLEVARAILIDLGVKDSVPPRELESSKEALRGLIRGAKNLDEPERTARLEQIGEIFMKHKVLNQ